MSIVPAGYRLACLIEKTPLPMRYRLFAILSRRCGVCGSGKNFRNSCKFKAAAPEQKERKLASEYYLWRLRRLIKKQGCEYRLQSAPDNLWGILITGNNKEFKLMRNNSGKNKNGFPAKELLRLVKKHFLYAQNRPVSFKAWNDELAARKKRGEEYQLKHYGYVRSY